MCSVGGGNLETGMCGVGKGTGTRACVLLGGTRRPAYFVGGGD